MALPLRRGSTRAKGGRTGVKYYLIHRILITPQKAS
jgi:hypothetical protein